MKWAYVIRYKLKAAAILLVIIVTILAGNLYERKNFNTLDKSISTIYQDRLMPATYIYELSNHLFRKRLIQEHYGERSPEQQQIRIAEHDAAINTLLADYEKTYLTEEERLHWAGLKDAMYNYNIQYNIAIANSRNAADGMNDQQLAHHFNSVMTELDALSKIQAGVGHSIEKDSHAIITGSVLPSYFENSLLVVLGVICVVLFSVSDNRIMQQAQRSSLN